MDVDRYPFSLPVVLYFASGIKIGLPQPMHGCQKDEPNGNATRSSFARLETISFWWCRGMVAESTILV